LFAPAFIANEPDGSCLIYSLPPKRFKMNRIKQLDSIRAIAILLVMMHHAPLGPVTIFLSACPLGANTFFVLSGFLITGILLKEQKNAGSGISRLTVFRNFLIRRALRIFPLYFLTIFLLLFLAGSGDKSRFIYFFTFTSNFYFFSIKAWDHQTAHLWSISVQEQFYIFWPWVLLLCRRRYLLHAICLFILAGIISHFFVGLSEFGSILTIDCFDSLGLGSLLAWITYNRPQLLARAYSFIRVAGIVSIIILLVCIVAGLPLAPKRTLVSILALWLITAVVYKNREGRADGMSLLNSKALLFIGKISFGLYLFHQVLPSYTKKPLDWLINNRLPVALDAYYVFFLVMENIVILILFSWLLWRFIEKPFMGLKKYLPAGNKERTPQPAMQTT